MGVKTTKMALERFLTKKLSNADETNWLLQKDDELGDELVEGETNQHTTTKRVRPAKWMYENGFTVNSGTAYEAINIAIDDSPDDTSTGHNNFGYDGDDDGDGGSELLDAHYHHREDQANAKENEERRQAAKKKLITASIICTVFLIAEIIGGLLSHSIAILSDACHMFTDLSSFMLSLIALSLSSKAPSRNYNFGYSRIEIIVAIFNVLFIWILTGALVKEAVDRIREPDEFELDGKVMLIVSSLAVFFNMTLGITLHDFHGHSHGGHGHSHGGQSGHSHGEAEKSAHSHQHKHNDDEMAYDSGTHSPDSKKSGFSLTSMAESTKSQDINVRAAMVHVLGDLLQSIGVFIASVLIYLNPSWKIADPICTFIFSVLVLCTTIPIMRDTLRILMQAAPANQNHEKVSHALLEIKGVLMIHDLKIWTLSGDKTVVSCHIAVEDESMIQSSMILLRCTKLLKNRFGFTDTTVQLEKFSKEMLACEVCKVFDK